MSRPQSGLSSFNAILSSKGRVAVPAKVRLALHLSMGDRVESLEVGPGRIEFVAATRSVTELKGMFGKANQVVSIAEMNRVLVAQGVKARN